MVGRAIQSTGGAWFVRHGLGNAEVVQKSYRLGCRFSCGDRRGGLAGRAAHDAKSPESPAASPGSSPKSHRSRPSGSTSRDETGAGSRKAGGDFKRESGGGGSGSRGRAGGRGETAG